jgi:hypothetical protein
MSYKYSVNVGLVQEKLINMKKLVFGVIATATVVGATAVPALAAGNSTPGLDRYLSNPGRQQATDVGAQCGSGAGSGAFGYLGKGNNPGDPSWDGGNGTDPGTSGQQTGLNNSAVCGNRQGNLN